MKKTERMWAVGDYGSSAYLSSRPLTENKLRSIYARGGKYNKWYCKFTQLYHTLLLIFILRLAVGMAAGRNEEEGFLFGLIFTGVFLFFLLWECNSRYLIVFLPAMAMGAVMGMERSCHRVRKERNYAKNTCFIHCNSML